MYGGQRSGVELSHGRALKAGIIAEPARRSDVRSDGPGRRRCATYPAYMRSLRIHAVVTPLHEDTGGASATLGAHPAFLQ